MKNIHWEINGRKHLERCAEGGITYKPNTETRHIKNKLCQNKAHFMCLVFDVPYSHSRVRHINVSCSGRPQNKAHGTRHMKQGTKNKAHSMCLVSSDNNARPKGNQTRANGNKTHFHENKAHFHRKQGTFSQKQGTFPMCLVFTVCLVFGSAKTRHIETRHTCKMCLVSLNTKT